MSVLIAPVECLIVRALFAKITVGSSGYAYLKKKKKN